jgi:hypothetical protein
MREIAETNTPKNVCFLYFSTQFTQYDVFMEELFLWFLYVVDAS